MGLASALMMAALAGVLGFKWLWWLQGLVFNIKCLLGDSVPWGLVGVQLLQPCINELYSRLA